MTKLKRKVRFGLIFIGFSLSMLIRFSAGAQVQQNAIIAVAAGERYYAAAYSDLSIRVWNAATQQPEFTIPYENDFRGEPPFTYGIRELAFSPNGDYLAVSFGGGSSFGALIRVYSAYTGKLVKQLDAWSEIGAISWKPDGTQLAAFVFTGGGTVLFGHLTIWSIPAGDVLKDQDFGSESSTFTVIWSKDGSHLVGVAGADLYFIDFATGLSKSILVFPTRITDFTWSPDGKHLAAVDALGTVYVADLSTRQIMMTFPGTSSDEYGRKIVWNADNLIAATSDNLVRVWDGTNGDLLAHFDTPYVMDVDWLASNTLLLAEGIATPAVPRIVRFTPAITTITPTYTLTPSPTLYLLPFPQTSVLDNFNRVDGPVGNHWGGDSQWFTITNHQLRMSNEVIGWTSAFGPEQEVFVTLSSFAEGDEIDLYLKSESVSGMNRRIDVGYQDPSGSVVICTFSPGQDTPWCNADISMTLHTGDQFGARAFSNGMVEVYKNGEFAGSVDVSEWPFNDRGGFIGVSGHATIDNFGGGNILDVPRPTLTPND